MFISTKNSWDRVNTLFNEELFNEEMGIYDRYNLCSMDYKIKTLATEPK